MSQAVIYSNAVKVKAELDEDLKNSSSNLHYSQIQTKLSKFNSLIKELNDLARRQVTADKRNIILTRVQQLEVDSKAIQSELNRLKTEESQRVAAARRELLLGNQQQMNHRKNQDETVSSILSLDEREEKTLNNVSDSIDQYLQIAGNSLQELYDQRSMLKKTQRRLLDAANKLGLSTTIIRFIEQRSKSDQLILYGLIAFSIVMMIAIVHFFG
ncbi:hypothetical protein BC833DRAFT_609906 [Globomyces pollinis-pini]|nr:hypothetical protein BC833DRAFT_609906 [Globomyces pollinis-pini]